MKEEDMLFFSIFVLFLGFLIFIFSIMNKGYQFMPIVDKYYVLFILFGLITLMAGFILLLAWHVRVRQPFQEESEISKGFTGQFVIGIVLLTFSFLYLFYFKSNNSFYMVFIILSIIGILFLIKGVRNYWKSIEKKIERS